ncbi:flagellar motor protein [Pelotomaculum terephthalicicum JT]|uniref:flagellar motor protein n=1 Tax=Pelotomaculum TaxID=191373 RepID=UPI0009D56049|nr:MULTISPECIES: flagellar motor protein [Pelotomaculum]MCG9968011.1 flagellar motor protein [Pelotomaculum terephthalicicum JT]OPX88870.1 MAG: Chemotaxis protein PomA [Pelotomaculum sp. PtaB.Bin117]OPY60812.1 MAG: Chemotaxis protein PomA [Pelotomaculum sp. PtaU1.Bin065]
MEITTVAGILLGILSLVTAFVIDGGHVLSLIKPTAAMIVFGGTIGATIISFSLKEIMTVPKLFKIILFQKLPDEIALIEQLVSLADKVRREGLLYLENELPNVDDSFMRKGIQLVVDGTDPELVRQIMETEMYAVQERHNVGANIFEAAGGYAPTMGIIGTVMGLVHVLSNLESPEELGPSIALAFIATLYGVGSANLLWIPIAGKLKNLSKKEAMLREMMLEGIMSIQAGYNPVLIRERLTAFLKPKSSAGAQESEEEE